jgi:hypothetical protein
VVDNSELPNRLIIGMIDRGEYVDLPIVRNATGASGGQHWSIENEPARHLVIPIGIYPDGDSYSPQCRARYEEYKSVCKPEFWEESVPIDLKSREYDRIIAQLEDCMYGRLAFIESCDVDTKKSTGHVNAIKRIYNRILEAELKQAGVWIDITIEVIRSNREKEFLKWDAAFVDDLLALPRDDLVAFIKSKQLCTSDVWQIIFRDFYTKITQLNQKNLVYLVLVGGRICYPMREIYNLPGGATSIKR